MRRHPSRAQAARRARACAAAVAAWPTIVCADASPFTPTPWPLDTSAPPPPAQNFAAPAPTAAAGAAAGPVPLAPAPAGAQPPADAASQPSRPPPLALSVDGNLTATDNATAAPDDQRRADVLAILRPRAQWRHQGAGLRADVDVAAVMTASAAGRVPATARPDATATASAMLVDQWVGVDASARAATVEADPFGPRVQDTSAANQRVSQSYAISPYLRRRVGNLTVLARRDDGITLHAPGTDTTQVTSGSVLRLDLEPQPLGATASVSRRDSNDRGVALSRFTIEEARGGAMLALDGGDLRLGAEGGRDRVRTALTQHDDPMASASIDWHPTPRTDIAGSVQKRFFGHGGTFTVTHRTPFTSVSLRLSREPVLESETLGGGAGAPGGGPATLRSALDAILTTRYPDAAVRAGLVDTLLAGRGGDQLLGGPVGLVADYPQLLSQALVTWALLTPRTTLTVSGYTRTVQAIRRDGDPLEGLPGGSLDSRQSGGSLQVSRKLAPTLSFDALAQASRIQGLGDAHGNRSDDRVARLWITKGLSPRATLTTGLQVERFSSTVTGQADYTTRLAFLGFTERF